MVRINIVNPKLLLDQHLLAENVEILMLKGSRLKGEVPNSYRLGKGHILFFSNKPNYLIYRQYEIKRELIERGFKASVELPLFIGEVEFKPKKEDFNILLRRLIEKVKLKPNYYNYYSKPIKANFYIELLEGLIKGESSEEEIINKLTIFKGQLSVNNN